MRLFSDDAQLLESYRDGSDVKIHISADADPFGNTSAKAPRMRIHMWMPVQEDPRMRIFVTY